MIVIALVVVTAILLTSDLEDASDVVSVLLVGVSLAVAAVPEGLPAVLSVVLALGVQRMATRRAIVKRLSSVETLGSASVVCSDKTGTLTRNEMTIEKVVTGSGEVDVTGSGYRPEGELLVDGRPLEDPVLLDEVRAVLVGGSLANDAVLREEDGEWTIQGDPTEAAFLVAEAKVEGLHEAREARFERVGEVPFTSERKLMSTLERDLEGELGLAVVTKGAPDVLLARCTSERVAGEVLPLTDARREDILDRRRAARRPGSAHARRRLPAAPGRRRRAARRVARAGARLPRDRGDHRPAAGGGADGDRRGATAGVRVLMITGDHPRTAARIASDLRIVEPGSRALTGAELEAADDEDLRLAARDVSVYARVAPEHKLRIVNALQADDQIVAMTGDGVNDAPALKTADIGVAMGITGTDVTKEAADMILADDNFATIVAAVREGRGIFANIRKFLRFLLSSNIGEVLTMFFGVVLAGVIGLDDTGEAVAVPLLATQILWINLLTDSAPALALGVDPPPDDVMERPPRRLSDRVIDGRDVVRHRLGRARDGGRDARRARPRPPRGPDRGRGGDRRGALDGVHHARARPALQLLQRALGPHERLPPPLHQQVALGRDRALAPAADRRRAAAVPERRFRDSAARADRLARLRRPGERRPLGGRGEEAARAVAAELVTAL